MIGKIGHISVDRGFAFLESNESTNRSIFLHASQIRNRTWEEMRYGDRVEFDLGADSQGRLQAKNARVISAPADPCEGVRRYLKEDDGEAA